MLGLLGLVAIIVFTIQVYKTANNTERNGTLWALLTVGIGITVQFVVPFIFGIAIVFYYLATGRPLDDVGSDLFGLTVVTTVVTIALSIVGMVLVMKHVSKVRDDPPMSSIQPPPPPPSFGQPALSDFEPDRNISGE